MTPGGGLFSERIADVFSERAGYSVFIQLPARLELAVAGLCCIICRRGSRGRRRVTTPDAVIYSLAV
jgi:hypothetical protein